MNATVRRGLLLSGISLVPYLALVVLAEVLRRLELFTLSSLVQIPILVIVLAFLVGVGMIVVGLIRRR